MRLLPIRGALLSVLFTSAVFAADPEEAGAEPPEHHPRSVLSAHPVGTLAGLVMTADSGMTAVTLPVEYEFAALRHLAFTVGVAPIALLSAARNGFGIGGQVGLRLYPFGRAPDGWWFGPSIAYLALEAWTDTENVVPLFAATGYQWIIGGRWILGATVSLGMLTPADPTSLFVLATIPVGVAF